MASLRGLHFQVQHACYLNLPIKNKTTNMSCCGKQRKQWLHQVRSQGQQKVENVPKAVTHNKPERVFEYTGRISLTVTAPSGRSYNFSFKGQRVTVDYADSFTLMGEKDLRIVQ